MVLGSFIYFLIEGQERHTNACNFIRSGPLSSVLWQWKPQYL